MVLRARAPRSNAPIPPPTDTLLPTEVDAGGYAPGRIEGAGISVDHDGGARSSVPLWVPPGRAGLQPDLALTYSSRGGDGMLGVGWSVTTTSAITRCPKTLPHDGEPAPIRFDATDPLCLDGARLVLVSGVHSRDGAEYRTEADQMARVVIRGNDERGPLAFAVYERSGRIRMYGGGGGGTLKGPRVRITATTGNAPDYTSTSWDPDYRLGWAVTQVSDRAGNLMEYTYQAIQGGASGYEHLPSEIRYTANLGLGVGHRRSIKFFYEERPDVRTQFVAGFKLRHGHRMRRIEMWGPSPTTSALLRSYALGYRNDSTSRRSLLASVTECDRAGVCVRPTNFDYELGQFGFDDIDTGILDIPVTYTGTSPQNHLHSAITVLDANGDGRDDILYRTYDEVANNGSVQSWIRLAATSRAGFGVRELVADLPRDLLYSQAFDPRPIDLDADDKTDLLVLKPWVPSTQTFGHWRMYRRGSTGYQWAPETVESSSSFTGTSAYPPIYAVDGDGDGLPEIMRGRYRDWAFRPNTGASLDDYVVSTQCMLGTGTYASAVDIDGDGATELLAQNCRRNADGTQSNPDGRYVALRPSSRTRTVGVTATTLPANPGLDLPLSFVNVDGDGLADALYINSLQIHVRRNTGVGFLARETHNFENDFAHAPGEPALNSLQRGDDGNRVLDYDGDGRVDFLLTQQHHARARQMTILRSTEVGFEPIALPIPRGEVEQPTHYQNAEGPRMTKVLDVNGDDLADIVQVIGGRLHLYLRKGKRPDMLVRVTDGFRQKFEVDYQPMTGNAYVQRSATVCSYPQRCVRRGSWVVSESRRDDGVNAMRRSWHWYSGARVDVRGRGWLGMASHTVEDVITRASVTTTMDNITRLPSGIYPYAGQPVRVLSGVDVHNASGQVVRHEQDVTYNYDVKYPTGSAGNFFVSLASVKRVEREGSLVTSDVTMANDVDDFGNVTWRRGFTAGGRRLNIATTFENRTTDWLIGLPTRVEDTSGIDNASVSVTRTRAYEYDARGLLVAETVEPDSDDSSLKLRTTLTRDSQTGLVRSMSVTSSVDGVRTTSVEYDALERAYPAVITNALGHIVKAALHPGLGLEAVAEDANGLRVSKQYDGFGRVRRVNRPDDADAEVWYEASNVAAISITATQQGHGHSNVHLDRLGRAILSNEMGWDESVVTAGTTYDALGRVASESRPHFDYEEVLRSRYTYDELNRPLTADHPDGTGTSWEYSGLTTTFYNEKGDRHVERVDEVGNVVVSAQLDSMGRTNATSFAWGPFEQLSAVTMPGGHVAAMEYDTLGRQLGLLDPDAGYKQTEYSAFGEPTRDIQGNGKITTYQRDSLGRVVAAATPEGPVTFAWDVGEHAIGQLSRATTSTATNSVATQFTYDQLGRTARAQWTIDGDAFEISATYDAYGRPDRLVYPAHDGAGHTYAVRHVFDNRGNLRELRNGTDNTVLWQAEYRNAIGQLTMERFGNGVGTTRTFDAANGLLRKIESKANATQLQNLTYDWDVTGNLQVRTDLVASTRETFRHDYLQRLTAWNVRTSTGTVLGHFGYTYDDTGNILRKQAVGRTGSNTSIDWAFGYDQSGAGPHAVTSSPWGRYTYDGAGNQVTGPQRAITFNSLNLPERIVADDRTVDFTYDAAGQRVRKQSGTDVTTYIAGIYEQRREGNDIKHVHYVQAQGVTVAQLVKVERVGAIVAESTAFFHNDHLGSPETITDASGNVVERLKFDPFGQRIDIQNPIAEFTPAVSDVTRGFTGHENDDETGLVNMGGRLYDPRLMRFLSADPFVAFPTFGQSYNRYSYALNAPLRYVDPTGFNPEPYFESDTCPAGTVDAGDGEVATVLGDGGGSIRGTSFCSTLNDFASDGQRGLGSEGGDAGATGASGGPAATVTEGPRAGSGGSGSSLLGGALAPLPTVGPSADDASTTRGTGPATGAGPDGPSKPGGKGGGGGSGGDGALGVGAGLAIGAAAGYGVAAGFAALLAALTPAGAAAVVIAVGLIAVYGLIDGGAEALVGSGARILHGEGTFGDGFAMGSLVGGFGRTPRASAMPVESVAATTAARAGGAAMRELTGAQLAKVVGGAVDPNRPAIEVLTGTLKRRFPSQYFGNSLNEIKAMLRTARGQEKVDLQQAKKALDQGKRLMGKNY